MVDTVVRDANGADLARLLCFDESAPGAQASFTAAEGRVDQVKVDVGELGLAQGRGDGFLDRGWNDELAGLLVFC